MSSDPSLNIAARGNQFLYVDWTNGVVDQGYQLSAGTLFVTDTSIDPESAASALYKIPVVPTDLSFTITTLTNSAGETFQLQNGTQYMVVYMQTSVPTGAFLYQGAQVKTSPPQLGIPADAPNAPTILNVINYDEFAQLIVQYNSNNGDGLKLIEFVCYAPSINVCETSKFFLDLPLNTPIDASGVYDISNGAVQNYIQAEVSCYTYNEIGQSGMSNTVVVFPTDVPNAPTNAVIAAPYINQTVVASWDAPSDAAPPIGPSYGWTPVLNYILDVSGIDNNTRFDISLSSADLDLSFAQVFTGLSYEIPSSYFNNPNDLGKYFKVRVAAVNLYGVGPYSAFSTTSAAPYLNPDPITDLSITELDEQLVATWNAPIFTGGFPLTTYQVDISGLTLFQTTYVAGSSPLTTSFTDLSNGQDYTITVYARNTGGNPVQAGGLGVSSPVSAVASPQGVPFAPVLSLDSYIGDSIIVNWTAPDDNGRPIINYKLYIDLSMILLGPSDLSYTFTGLTNGQSYQVSVLAVNSFGDGALSNVVDATGAPTLNPIIINDGVEDQQLSISWTAPSGPGTITGYNVYVDDAFNQFVASPTLIATITGLTNGQVYDITVASVSADGEGAMSNMEQGKPGAVPDAPVLDPLGISNQTLTINWSIPADNGYELLSYKVYLDGDLNQVVNDPTTTTATITGLTNGEVYTVAVSAVNAIGEGALSNTENGAPGIVPEQIANVNIVELNQRLDLSWNAPYDGGFPIDYYQIDMCGTIFTTTDLSYTITGLINGVDYNIKVRAHNEFGFGAYSVPEIASPGDVPLAPPSFSGQQADQSVVLTWANNVPTPPYNNGGRPITNYFVDISVNGVYLRTDSTNGPVNVYTALGLTNGLTYEFAVRASNDQFGSGAPSASISVIPAGAPGSPQGVNTGSIDLSAVTVYFNNPSNIVNGTTNGSPIDNFYLYLETDGVLNPIPFATITPAGPNDPLYEYSYILTGLTQGVQYRVGAATFVTINGNAVASQIDYSPIFTPSSYPIATIYDISAAPVNKVFVRVQVSGSALLNYTCLIPNLADSTYEIVEGNFDGVDFSSYINDPNSYYYFEIQSPIDLAPYLTQPALVHISNGAGVGYAATAMPNITA